MNVSKFIKENIPLCVCTLGLAIVGYMGYHAVRWIINKCQKTEKIDQVAQKHLKSPDIPIDQIKSSKTPKSLVNRVSNLDFTEGKVNTGQGEYIVFHNLPSGEKKEVAGDTYKQVYEILNEYAPASIVNRNSDSAMEECDNRYEIIKSKVKKIDPTLEVVFVPRTLYELIFIRKCIQEDLKHNEVCSQLSPATYLKTVKLEDYKGDREKFESFQKERLKTLAQKKCWHLCYFDDVGDNDHPGVRDVAYRLNRVVVKTLSPTADGFTTGELFKHVENEIEFLKKHYSNNSVGNCNYPGPTTNFSGESMRGVIRSMGIRDDKDAQIIRDAIAIECSQIARKAFFLYRGADFQNDSANCLSNKNKPYSLSFGSSLFAGSLYDGGATAFYYMRKGKNAYAIPVPFDQINSSPFFIPPTNTVARLFGNGEIFHGRTKAWKDYDLEKIDGFPGSAKNFKTDHLKSELSKDEVLTQFQYYKNQAIQLK